MAKVISGFAVLGLCLAGLNSSAAAAEGVRYVCSDKTELTVMFHASPGSADLVFDGSQKKMTLPQVLSADGARYADGSTEFWIKGRDASLTRGQNKTTCKS